MDFVNEEVKQISNYNDAVNSIQRLNDKWLRCSSYLRTGNFKAWKYQLDDIWLELYPDILKLTKNERKWCFYKNKELLLKIANCKERVELYWSLIKRHELLRKIQGITGKAGKYRDKNEEGFE